MMFLNKLKDKYRAIDIVPSFLFVVSIFLGGLREFNEWVIFSLMLIGIFLFFRKKIKIEEVGLWLVFGVWILISIFFSHVPPESFWQFSKYLLFILFFCFTASSTKPALKLWVFVVFGFALLSAITVFYQTSDFSLLLPKNPNYTASFFAACAAALVLLISSVRSIKARALAAALLMVFFSAIIVVGSRGALLSFIIVSMLILIYRGYYRTFIISLFLIALSLIFLPQELIGNLLKTYDSHAFQRLNIWKTAFEGIYLHPIWGYGAGGFENLFAHLKFPAFDGLSYFGHYARHAHSEILNIAATSGIAAAVIFIAAFIKSLKFEIKNNIYADIVRVFAITVFLQSCVDIIFYSGSLNLLFFGSLGFIASFSEIKKNQSNNTIKPSVLILLSIVLVGSLYIKQKHDSLRDRVLNHRPLDSWKVSGLEKISKFNEGDEVLLFKIAKTKYSINSNYVSTLAYCRQAEKIYPLSWTFKLMQAEIYFNALNYSKAKEKIKETLTIEPNCLSARLLLSEILYIEGQFKDSLKETLVMDKIIRKSKSLRLSNYNKRVLGFNKDRYDELINQL
ncbi:MAG: hypothetical protein U9Q34_08720 [Elusimicrobiota bacterium]|nr:hypothetical protein [Elusimicrobiota bacterium]